MFVPPSPRLIPEDFEGRVALAVVRHTFLEDVYALLTGCGLAVLGLVLLKSAGLVTGGVAGLALLLAYIVPIPAGVLFALLNIPFFVFARRTMGRAAMFRSVAGNVLISAFAIAAPFAFRIDQVDGLFAALAGGTLVGIGLLLLARHQVGVGGLGILALALQKSHGFNPGRTQLIGDCVILGAAMLAINMGPTQFALSVLSAIAVAGVLIVFHRPGRYTGY